MLLVPVQVARSVIDGLGVIAAAPIAKGSVVWRFTPGFDIDIDPRELDLQPAHFRKILLHYGYIDQRLNRFILCCDDARFINHSDTPNIRSESDNDPHGIDVAVRDIAAGEEITIDYDWVEGSRPSPSGSDHGKLLSR